MNDDSKKHLSRMAVKFARAQFQEQRARLVGDTFEARDYQTQMESAAVELIRSLIDDGLIDDSARDIFRRFDSLRYQLHQAYSDGEVINELGDETLNEVQA